MAAAGEPATHADSTEPAPETNDGQLQEAKHQEVIYLTGYNASGKTTLGQHIADTYKEWGCIDGDAFVDNDLELLSLLKAASSQVLHLMRGTFGKGREDLIAEVRQQDTEVRAAMEPFFRSLFQRLSEHVSSSENREGTKGGNRKRKVVFVYHVWRRWTLDVFREFFPASKFVEVQVARNILLDRFVRREAEQGLDHEASWRDCQGERFSLLRRHFGPEYRGNEENYKRFVEWRFYFYREPWWEWEVPGEKLRDVHVVNNDSFEAAQELEQILGA